MAEVDPLAKRAGKSSPLVNLIRRLKWHFLSLIIIFSEGNYESQILQLYEMKKVSARKRLSKSKDLILQSPNPKAEFYGRELTHYNAKRPFPKSSFGEEGIDLLQIDFNFNKFLLTN
ncbi:sigma-70 family RNA polymerase sigma factor, partial [Striga asiatica]